MFQLVLVKNWISTDSYRRRNLPCRQNSGDLQVEEPLLSGPHAEEEVLPSSSQSFYYANVYHTCSRRDPACGSATSKARLLGLKSVFERC